MVLSEVLVEVVLSEVLVEVVLSEVLVEAVLTEVAMGFCLTASVKLSIHKQQTNVKLIFVYTGTTGGGNGGMLSSRKSTD